MEGCGLRVFIVLVLADLMQIPAQQLECSSCSDEETAEVVDVGNAACSFRRQQDGQTSLCAYKQSCMNADAGPWVEKPDWIEVNGSGSDYSAYSTLQSSRVHVQEASCLRFYFAQTLPCKLTVIVGGQCVFQGIDMEQTTLGIGQAAISPGNFTIEFRAQNMAQESTWVRLRDVTLQPGACSDTADPVRILTQSRGLGLALDVQISLCFPILIFLLFR